MTRRKLKESYGTTRVERRDLIINAVICVLGLLLVIMIVHTLKMYDIGTK